MKQFMVIYYGGEYEVVRANSWLLLISKISSRDILSITEIRDDNVYL